MNQKIIFVVGPTAVGKTAVALRLAKKLKTEIVSCDAMQVYRQLDIAGNKPSACELKAVKHHLVGIIPPTKEFNVAAFERLARKAIRDILKRGKIPIVSGGSGMYMQVLLDGIFGGSTKDEALRGRLTERVQEEGNAALYAELKIADPAAAQRIHVNDTHRIVRALEVYQLTRQPISELQKKRSGLWGKHQIFLYALNRDRAELYRRIDDRVEMMFKQGLVEELKALQRRTLSPMAAKMIGVPEVRGYLQGDYDLARAKELMKLNTRHFAKRQLTWFRREKRLEWFQVTADADYDTIVKGILKEIA